MSNDAAYTATGTTYLPQASSTPLWQRRLNLEREYHFCEGDEDMMPTPRHKIVAVAGLVVFKALGLWERGRRNALSPVMRRVEVCKPDLPAALDGLRILHLSDPHFRRDGHEQSAAIAKLLDGVEADIVTITGDFKYGHMGTSEHIPLHVSRSLAGVRSRHGVFAILGNHDNGEVVPLLQGMGVNMLVNEGMALRINDTDIWIGGTDDPHFFACDDLNAAFAQAPEDAFKIAMVHSPERVPEAAALGVDLYLCGHTHGGQLCLPGIGAIRMNARCPRRYTLRQWQHGAMHGYTSTGLGATDIPLRFNCPPEACLLTLRRAAGDGVGRMSSRAGADV